MYGFRTRLFFLVLFVGYLLDKRLSLLVNWFGTLWIESSFILSISELNLDNVFPMVLWWRLCLTFWWLVIYSQSFSRLLRPLTIIQKYLEHYLSKKRARKSIDSNRTRTENLLLRRQEPYPLGRRASYYSILDWKIQNRCWSWRCWLNYVCYDFVVFRMSISYAHR